MTQTYPEISIQSVIDPSPWWLEDQTKDFRRGRLIRDFLPHVDQTPYRLVAVGRSEASKHQEAIYRIETLKIKKPHRQDILPVAAMPTYPGETRIVQRAKKRPALIISEGGLLVPRELARNRPKWQVALTLLVAPYYGGEQDQKRAGYPLAFLDRVRRCEFPQYMVEILPPKATSESILRYDHIQPIGRHHESIEVTEFCLSEDAMVIVDEWVQWMITGLLPEDGLIYPARKEFMCSYRDLIRHTSEAH